MAISLSFITSASAGGSSVSSHTFSSVSFGTAASDRLIIVGISTDNGGTGASSVPSSVTIGGVTATQYTGGQVASSGTYFYTYLYAAYVPTGTTGNIVINYTGSAWATAIYVYRATGARITKYSSSVTGAAGGSFSYTVATAANGAMISCSNFNGSNLTSSDITLTGVTEQAELQQGNLARRSASGMNTSTTDSSGYGFGASCSGTVAMGVVCVVSLQEMSSLQATTASFGITGNNSVLRVNRVLGSQTSSFGIQGVNALLTKGYKIGAQVGTFTPRKNTNLIIRSSDPNLAWTKVRCTISNDTIQGILGNLVDKVIETTDTGQHYLYQYTSATLNSDPLKLYVQSFYAKAGERTIVQARCNSNTTTNYFFATFDLVNGIVTGSGKGGESVIAASGIEYAKDGWYRCWVAGYPRTTVSTDNQIRHLVFSCLDAATNTYTGDGTSGYYIDGLQIEQRDDPVPSEYILTTTTVVTSTMEYARLRYNRAISTLKGSFTIAGNNCILDHNKILLASTGSFTPRKRTNYFKLSEDLTNTSVWGRARLANITTDGTLTPSGVLACKLIEDTTASSTHYTYSYSGQTPVYEAGKKYCLSFIAKAGERPAICVTLPSSAFGDTSCYFNLTDGTMLAGGSPEVSMEYVKDGWWRCKLSKVAIATISGSSPAICISPSVGSNAFTYTGDGVSGLYVSEMQLEVGEVGPTNYIRSLSNSTTISTDEYANLKFNRGIGAGTGVFTPAVHKNYVKYSEDLYGAGWGRLATTITSDAIQSPMSTMADKLYVFNTASSVKYIGRTMDSSVSSLQPLVFSVYARAAEYRYIMLALFGGGGTTDCGQVWFDLQGGIQTSYYRGGSSTTPTWGIQDVGNGWYRCWVSCQPSTTEGATRGYVYLTPNSSGTTVHTGVAGDGLYLWGFQFEPGNYPSMYMPALSGIDVSSTLEYAGLKYNRNMVANTGSLSIVGKSSILRRNLKLVATKKTMTISGKSINMSRNRRLAVTKGLFNITGNNLGSASFRLPHSIITLLGLSPLGSSGKSQQIPRSILSLRNSIGYYKVQTIKYTGEPVPLAHMQDSKKLEADAYVELFEITLAGGNSKLYLKSDHDCTWQGHTYEGTLIKIEGVGTYADDEVARPKLTVLNPNGVFSPLIDQGYMDNAKVARIRVLKEHIDADLPVYRRQQWYVKRVASILGNVVNFELRDMMDGQNFLTPGRMFIPPEFAMVSLN